MHVLQWPRYGQKQGTWLQASLVGEGKVFDKFPLCYCYFFPWVYLLEKWASFLLAFSAHVLFLPHQSSAI